MYLEFYEVIENRKSIKKFKSNTLDEGKISRMINAAMMAPSWKNKTSYKFILVDDRNEKDRLAAAVMNDGNEAANAIKEAPMVAVVVADPSKSGEVEEREYYLVDSAIAMEHFVLAATAEGYGTCWVGAVDEDKAREILSIPQNYRVVAMTPIGEIEQKEPHYPKKEIGDYVFHNSWDKAYTTGRSGMKH
jgi:nitroreductase